MSIEMEHLTAIDWDREFEAAVARLTKLRRRLLLHRVTVVLFAAMILLSAHLLTC